MSIVTMSDLEPELSQKIRGFEDEIRTLKTETEVVRKLINDIKGLTKENVEYEIKKTRDENKR